jgi:plasmid stabilization system protein ParE
MVKKINWTSQTREDYRDIISYLLDKWSFEIADKFTDHVDEVLKLLEVHHNLGMALDRLTAIRKIAIQPHFTLF